MKNRISQRLLHHQNELRKRALKEKDEKLRKDYWWLYHNAKDIEPEVREMVLKAENCSMLERIIESGLIHVMLEDEKDNLPPPEEDKPQVSDSEPPDHEDDIPPRQMGFWDEKDSPQRHREHKKIYKGATHCAPTYTIS